MENKKIANATHNIYAYRIYREDTKSFCQDCDDDGETQAGSRLLHLLQVNMTFGNISEYLCNFINLNYSVSSSFTDNGCT